ncbi:MAG: transglycosylase SLT domain-containing protein [Actinomycetota bacterium]|nr:transglycosylase SLT domain-containing protein [Actinomycetota bacterium]
MRLRALLPIVAATMLCAPAAASAAFPHSVAPGESLTSVAAADGLPVDQLAAANGLAPDATLVAGSTLMVPAQLSGAAQAGSTPTATAGTASAGDGDNDSDDSVSAGDGDNDSDDGGSAAGGSAATVAASPSPASAGSYVVQPGDTLSAIAGRAGLTIAELAAANGIDPNAPMLAGSILRLSGAGASSSASAPVASSAASAPVASSSASAPVASSASSPSVASAGAPSAGSLPQSSAGGPPYPTPGRVTAGQIGSVAAANGVPPSLAQAIGWQESGFNNNALSSANARGVMQILPGTWNWIGQNLAGATPLAPASPLGNVRGGVLLLHSLLSSTGGDPSLAAAAYYQGLSSVRQFGLFPETQQYVNNVLALRRQFGGG